MTKKDYIILARVLNAHASNECGNKQAQDLICAIADTLCDELRADNQAFNKTKFINAVFKK